MNEVDGRPAGATEREKTEAKLAACQAANAQLLQRAEQARHGLSVRAMGWLVGRLVQVAVLALVGGWAVRDLPVWRGLFSALCAVASTLILLEWSRDHNWNGSRR